MKNDFTDQMAKNASSGKCAAKMVFVPMVPSDSQANRALIKMQAKDSKDAKEKEARHKFLSFEPIHGSVKKDDNPLNEVPSRRKAEQRGREMLMSFRDEKVEPVE